MSLNSPFQQTTQKYLTYKGTRLGAILPFGLLFECSGEVLVENSSPKSGNNFSYFCLNQVFFHLVVGILRLQKLFVLSVWTFKLNLDVGILTFCLGDCFGYFFQNLDYFFAQSSGHSANLPD
jgi:hypothetical protein